MDCNSGDPCGKKDAEKSGGGKLNKRENADAEQGRHRRAIRPLVQDVHRHIFRCTGDDQRNGREQGCISQG